MVEPELIEIIEGPTPDFQPASQNWLHSVYQGPQVQEVAVCQLRTVSGKDIQERSVRAWSEGRPVRLDFPDELRLRQQLDVVALRLTQVEEGELLTIWVAVPVSYELDDEEDEEEVEDDDYEEGDPGLPF